MAIFRAQSKFSSSVVAMSNSKFYSLDSSSSSCSSAVVLKKHVTISDYELDLDYCSIPSISSIISSSNDSGIGGSLLPCFSGKSTTLVKKIIRLTSKRTYDLKKYTERIEPIKCITITRLCLSETLLQNKQNLDITTKDVKQSKKLNSLESKFLFESDGEGLKILTRICHDF